MTNVGRAGSRESLLSAGHAGGAAGDSPGVPAYLAKRNMPPKTVSTQRAAEITREKAMRVSQGGPGAGVWMGEAGTLGGDGMGKRWRREGCTASWKHR